MFNIRKRKKIFETSMIVSSLNAHWIECFAKKQICRNIWEVKYKTLEVVCNNYRAIYDELSVLDNKLKIHPRHLQFSAIKIYKSRKKFNPSFTWKDYMLKNIPYSLRKGVLLPFPDANIQKQSRPLLKNDKIRSKTWSKTP